MDASETVKEWKYWVLRWLLRGAKLGLPQWKLGVTATMPPIIALFEITIIFYILYGLRMP